MEEILEKDQSEVDELSNIIYLNAHSSEQEERARGHDPES